MEDIEVTLGYVHITWDTNGEEVTLEFINKEKEINIEKVTKDYYKLNMSATWIEDIPKNDTITLKVQCCLEMLLTIAICNVYHHIQITPTELVRKRRDKRLCDFLGNCLKTSSAHVMVYCQPFICCWEIPYS